MSKCWEMRGCDEEMASRCPHNAPGAKCPGNCAFSQCSRPTRKPTMDFDLLLRPDMDHTLAVKDICQNCEFFLKNAPSLQ